MLVDLDFTASAECESYFDDSFVFGRGEVHDSIEDRARLRVEVWLLL